MAVSKLPVCAFANTRKQNTPTPLLTIDGLFRGYLVGHAEPGDQILGVFPIREEGRAGQWIRRRRQRPNASGFVSAQSKTSPIARLLKRKASPVSGPAGAGFPRSTDYWRVD